MTNKEVAEMVVNRMLKVITEEGTLPWSKPWGKGRVIEVVDGYTEIELPVRAWSRNSGKQYRGVNTYLPVDEYATWNRIKAEGGKVLNWDEKWPIVFWEMRKGKRTKDDGTEEEYVYPYLKYYTVYRISNTTLGQAQNPEPEKLRIPKTHTEMVGGGKIAKNKVAEDVVLDYAERTKLKIIRDRISDSAYYSPKDDSVTVPLMEQFIDSPEYYSTLFHELTHSTGHDSRLGRLRENRISFWGDQNYSREELVAEIGAATILNTLGLESANSFRNSAAYVKSWASHIKDDPMMYVTAMTRAEKAVDLILGGSKNDKE